MANYPKKMKDPTEAALSAIQEALNLQQDEEQAASQPEGMADLLSGPAQSRAPSAPVAPASDEMFDSDAVGSRDLAGPAARAANDDQQSIGQILHALQRRPARSSYFVATAFSAAWIVGCLSLSFAYLSDINAALGPGRSPIALMIGLGAAALLPIIFFFGVAHMAWRAQELRLIAQSMARVAMRLAEPESVARDSIVTVGQAIRREVAAMGDGVERALARASELEALVQNEVAALERTYSDNEVRIRGLLQDLASQRDTLVGQAEQVRSAINNVHVDLTQDLSTISDLVGQQVSEAAQRITQALAERGEHITLTLGQIGDGMVAELSERGGDLLDRLEAASTETTQAISSASERLSSSLDFKTNHIGEEFAEIATGLEDMMTARLDRVAESFSEKSLAVVDLMVERSQELTEAIVETSNQLAETIAIRAEEVNSTLKSSGESLIVDLDLRGSEVANKLQETGSHIAETLISRCTAMTDQVRESAEHVAGVIATRNDAVKEMLATRLAAFEEMFNHTGAELGERIARDSSTLGNLITRHLAEFDRTVKTYGSELVERLGARTQDVSESMRTYVDSFDNRVTAKANEVTTALDQRLGRFQEALDSRSQTLTDALSARVVDISKTLADGSKEVAAAVDKRISDVTTLIDARAVKLADTLGERIATIDSTLGKGALDVANTLDGRIGQLEQLLIGRADAVVHQLELSSRSAADLLNSRMEQLSESIKSNSTSAERALTQLAANTTEALGKSAAASMAATETLNRSAAEATVALNRSAGALSNTITKSATAANETIGKTTTTAGDVLAKCAGVVNETIGKAMAGAADLLAKSATSANETIGKATTTASDLLIRSTQTSADAIGRSVNDAERKLVGMSTEVSRNLVGKANEIHTAMTQRVDDMARVLDQNSNGLIVALTGKGEQFAGEVSRATDQAVKAIDAKGFVFTQTMMDKSEEIARLINDASLSATGTITRTLGQLQEGAVGVTEAAKLTISRTLEELQRATKGAIEESKQTAAATVAEMMETHTMLRSDSTALFERLREANILLQEVLSGAQENMNSIEHTMAARVSEFVAAMSDLSSKSGATTAKVEQHLGTFNNVTAKVLHDLGDLADQFSSHGRTLADAVELLDTSNRRTDESIATRHATIEALVSTLDARTEDFGQRLERFSGLLDESLDTAAARAREIAGIIAESSNESVQSIEQQYELVRKTSDEERLRTSEALNSIYDEASSEAQAMFTQSAGRFTEIMEGMKQMAAEMQRELDTTRTELRRGILELPQETAESTAQMRRVIVDQIEALAELNRIVARHGRSLDAAEPARRDAEPLFAAGGGRAPTRPIRAEVAAAPPPQTPTPPRDITGAPTRRGNPPNLSPVQGGKDENAARNGGWLSDLLTRASRDDSPSIAPPGGREPSRGESRSEERLQRDSVDSIDSLSVDIARMIDHDAAADLWERYKRGERGAFTRRLYTQPGQKAFDEIRNKYRSDPEFRQTVEHYIHEFERLLDDVSRGDRGPAVARNYLISDTGKVYTMLAHAAGRFD
jgi:hypothetical protein